MELLRVAAAGSLFLLSLFVEPGFASAEMWRCERDSGSAIFTNQPIGDCQKHIATSGSFSFVSKNYSDQTIEELEEFIRQTPLGQLAARQEEQAKVLAAKQKSKRGKRLVKEKATSKKSGKVTGKLSILRDPK